MGRIIFLVLVVAVIIALFLPDSRSSGEKVPPAVRSQLQGHQVVVLSAEWCGYCKQLKRDLRDAKIPFKMLDVETTALGRQVADELDVAGLPTTIVGDEIIVGYEPDDIIDLARALPPASI
ncbi:hypothetical protein C7S18_10650 [Ahniella affigens]|uniref:Glutaredoxin domain-containing protein n=1 Tax=Ahniella affigens TaxID=2021234 RepID=A0A2P1PS18_9GAMM|nr:glutaredoxin family protein [Ahniella affigens]AVP97628.1 hypothetical protein C7S18_10650 [Ahniella affigens]